MSVRLSSALPGPARGSCRRRCRGRRRRACPRGRDGRGATESPSVGRVSTRLARPKSRTLTAPSGADHDVGGLEVAVDDALLVRGLERPAICRAMAERVVHAAAAPREPLGERRSLDELHHEAREPSRSPRGRRWRRCWGGSARRGAAPRARSGRGARGPAASAVGQGLERDVAMEPRVARPVNLAHAAPPDRRDDLVGANAHPRCERHGAAGVYRLRPEEGPGSARASPSAASRPSSSRS